MNRENNKVLYHYTNFSSFDNIMQYEELRVNNILNMNDEMEMRLFIEGLFDAVVKKVDNKDEIRKLFNDELKNEYMYSSYASCFSRYRDDAAQWERYGNYGKGVCIGFNRNKLELIIKSVATLHDVYYQDSMDEHYLVNEFVENSHDITMLKILMKEAWICSVAFKHPSFTSENEVRLVVTPFAQDYFNVKPKYNVNKDRIKKYYPINFNELCKNFNISFVDIIDEIIIGPESTQAVPILEDYLRDIGKEELINKVSLSSCPLRKRNYNNL